MLDLYQRKIDYMRISITDRCHFQCAYCKNDHPRKLKHQDILIFVDDHFYNKQSINLKLQVGNQQLEKIIFSLLKN